MSVNQLIKKAVQLNLRRCSVPFSTTSNRFSVESRVAVLELEEKLKAKSEQEVGQALPKTITVVGPQDISPISGIPEEHVKERLVRIYQTPKNAMQSGTENVDRWELEFETRGRWENPLMGWASTGDPHSNVKVQFHDKESAITYAEKNGWQWFIEPEKKVKPRVKSYGFNFSWNKRHRVSTK